MLGIDIAVISGVPCVSGTSGDRAGGRPVGLSAENKDYVAMTRSVRSAVVAIFGYVESMESS